MQDNEPGLFDLEDQAEEKTFEEPLISEEQVASIRGAFEQAGITSMEERQEVIESCTARPVANIRELQARDVRRVLKRIAERQNHQKPVSGSSWDTREEDTWIDKL